MTSKKEKLLWMWTIVALVGIYSTIGIAQPISNILLNNGLLTPLFILGMILVGMTVCVYGINKNPNKSVIAVSLGIVAIYLMVLVRMEIPQERTHIIEYGIVSALIYHALLERKAQGKKMPMPALLAILTTAFFGLIDELLQGLFPNRVFDVRDILFNMLAGTLSVVSITALNWVTTPEKTQ